MSEDNETLIEQVGPWSIWRVELDDDGRIFEIRDGYEILARHSDIVAAMERWNKLLGGQDGNRDAI